MPKKSHGEASTLYRLSQGRELNQNKKGRIAETAVLLRLTLLGVEVFTSTAGDEKFDFIVRPPRTGCIITIQVKWASHYPNPHVLPTFKLRCSDGCDNYRRYRDGKFDIVVAYYLFNDTAYVFSAFDAASNNMRVTVREDAAEAWHKITGDCGPEC